MKYIYLIYGGLFCLFMVMISCREEVDTHYPEFTPKPVINSILIVGEPITAHISIAVGYEEPSLSGCDNATVSLFIDNLFAGEMTWQEEGLYRIDTLVRSNTTYTLSVEIPGYETASGSTHIPPVTEYYDLTHINVAGLNEEGDSYPAIEFTFPVEPHHTHFFDARIILNAEGEIVSDLTPIYRSDSVLLNEGLPLTVFSDTILKGVEEYRMHINYTTGSYTYDDLMGNVTVLYPLLLEFRSVSKEYYLYARQRYLYERGRFPEFGIGSNTAYPLYSNVENGYGLVAGYAPFATDTLKPSY